MEATPSITIANVHSYKLRLHISASRQASPERPLTPRDAVAYIPSRYAVSYTQMLASVGHAVALFQSTAFFLDLEAPSRIEISGSRSRHSDLEPQVAPFSRWFILILDANERVTFLAPPQFFQPLNFALITQGGKYGKRQCCAPPPMHQLKHAKCFVMLSPIHSETNVHLQTARQWVDRGGTPLTH